LQLDPRRTSAWLARGLLRRRGGDLEGARGDLERAVELDPADVDARFDLGLTLLDLGQRAAAAAAFREVLAREPGDSEARRLLQEALAGG
jgi:tetratricopeptide (TPR) repeat protein